MKGRKTHHKFFLVCCSWQILLDSRLSRPVWDSNYIKHRKLLLAPQDIDIYAHKRSKFSRNFKPQLPLSMSSGVFKQGLVNLAYGITPVENKMDFTWFTAVSSQSDFLPGNQHVGMFSGDQSGQQSGPLNFQDSCFGSVCSSLSQKMAIQFLPFIPSTNLPRSLSASANVVGCSKKNRFQNYIRHTMRALNVDVAFAGKQVAISVLINKPSEQHCRH